MKQTELIQKLCRLIRYDVLTSTSQAGSGHPTSCLSAVELMTTLLFGGYFQTDLHDPSNPHNDRLIFSKGHAAPLLYSLYHAAGVISHEELLTLRTFGSRLQGHPTPDFPYAEIATGSLGQGFSVAVGMSLAMRLKEKDSLKTGGGTLNLPNIFVLLGDSELAEGQNWEAMEIASYYKLNNIVGIVDMSRLGQQGETMLGWNIKAHAARAHSFGCHTITVEDGNDIRLVKKAFDEAAEAQKTCHTPIMIIAKTVKGKGVSFLEDKDNWHGKALPKDLLERALKELGKVNMKVRGIIKTPSSTRRLLVAKESDIKQQLLADRIALFINEDKKKNVFRTTTYPVGSVVATREAFGDALVDLGKKNRQIVVLDAEMSNSTYEDKFKNVYPDRFFEMFIAEQNMVSSALGFSKMGYVPFVSSFAAFLTRTFDQIRMIQYSLPADTDKQTMTVNIVGSHAGVSIGADGPSQMGLEDIAMMRTIRDSIILYPADATSSFKLTECMMQQPGIHYLRTTREKTPVIYDETEEFKIGGLKILRTSEKDKAVVISAGLTLHEALKAYDVLRRKKIHVTVVDLYSVKPLDIQSLLSLAKKTPRFIVVEDHYEEGGIGDAVLSALAAHDCHLTDYTHLCVQKKPRSGTPAELLSYERIDAKTIVSCLH